MRVTSSYTVPHHHTQCHIIIHSVTSSYTVSHHHTQCHIIIQHTGNYAAFGKVTKGMELLDKIMTVETVKADKLEFLRDDKQKKAVWPADNFPATRQGIDRIVVK